MRRTHQGWHITAASTAGVAHLRSGRGNDDAFGCLSRHDGTLLLAAADGAGSAAHAAAGARLAVDAGLAALSLATGGWRSRLATAVSRIRGRLDRHAAERGHQLRDYACTLLLVEVGATRICAGQIGDGAVVVRRRGVNTLLGEPRRGRHVGETDFVTGADIPGRMGVAAAQLAGIDGVALLTDGLEPVALQANMPFAGFFDPLFDFALAAEQGDRDRNRSLAEFLASERVRARSHDDLTLLLAVRP